MSQKILFIGAGAIGSYLGAFLTRAGHDLTLIDAWSDQVEAIRERGFSVTGPMIRSRPGQRRGTCTMPRACPGISAWPSSL